MGTPEGGPGGQNDGTKELDSDCTHFIERKHDVLKF